MAFTEEWFAQHQAKMARVHAGLGLVVPAVDREPTSCQRPLTGKADQVVKSLAGAAGGAHAPAIMQSEDDLQVQVAEFLELALPPPLQFLHIPNGGHRHPAVAAKLKAFGVKPGAADVLILGFHPFVWIELKTTKGRLTQEQKEWRDWCRSIGAPWFLCRSLEDVIEALQSLQIRLIARAA
jgi:hypothetical protein